MIRARILGHDGQTFMNLTIDRNYPKLQVALPQRVELYRRDEDPSPIADAPKIGLAYYERTDGGGTRIYRLKVNL